MPEEPCLRDPVTAIHQGAIGAEEHRKAEIRCLDAARVLGDLPTGRGLTVEPTVLVELGDLLDEDSVNRQRSR